MGKERGWVEMVRNDVEQALKKKQEMNIAIQTERRLAYASNVMGYADNGGTPDLQTPIQMPNPPGYRTDLLICERVGQDADSRWVPRVVVEFKYWSVTTHDALTYSAKAATHKAVHPYLRYGIIIGNYDGPVPKRLIRHGQQFDFMATLASERLTEIDRDKLVKLLLEEVEASRTLTRLTAETANIWLLHKKLCINGDDGASI